MNSPSRRGSPSARPNGRGPSRGSAVGPSLTVAPSIARDHCRHQAETAAALLRSLVSDLFYVEDSSSGMPLRQLRVCSMLHQRPRTMSEISGELGVSLSAMSQIADRLERAGYVTRVAGKLDRRVKRLRLTPRGEYAMRQREESRIGRISAVFAHLSGDERARALAALEALKRACHQASVANESPGG